MGDILRMDKEGQQLLKNLIDKYYKPKMVFLEVGAGDGSLLKEIAKKYQTKGWGIDPYTSEHQDANVVLKALPAEEVSKIKRRFDIIFSIFSLHHFFNIDQFFNELKKVLTLSGKFFFVDWKKGTPTGVVEEYFSLEEILSKLVKHDFDIVEKGETHYHFYVVGALKK